ncbi:N-acetylmuramoyl-L-alanine amidase [Elusimicrobiota bacterium]
MKVNRLSIHAFFLSAAYCLLSTFLYAQKPIVKTTPDLKKIPFSIKYASGKKTRNFWAYKDGSTVYLPISELASIVHGTIHWYWRSNSATIKLKHKSSAEFVKDAKYIYAGPKRISLEHPVKALADKSNLLLPIKSLEQEWAEDLFLYRFDINDDNLTVERILDIKAPVITKNNEFFHITLDLPSALTDYEITFFPGIEPKKQPRLTVLFPNGRIPETPDSPYKSLPYKIKRDRIEKTADLSFELPPNTTIDDISAKLETWPAKRLNIVISRPQPPKEAPIIEPKPPIPPEKTAKVTKPKAMLKLKKKKRIKKPARESARARIGSAAIIIDAGHGGIDGGTVGKRKTLEKNVTLAIAGKLKKILGKKLPKRKIVMTRSTDKYISLEKRIRIAKKSNPVLFISIHANSTKGRHRGGFEIYIPSEIALDPKTARLALVENGAIKKKRRQHKKTKLKKLIVSESGRLARNLSTQLHNKIESKIRNRGIKRGDFFVLREANAPAVIIETGFLSYKKDEALLRNDKFQDKYAEALAQGIVSYLKGQARQAKK